jgi:hypothetical protein
MAYGYEVTLGLPQWSRPVVGRMARVSGTVFRGRCRIGAGLVDGGEQHLLVRGLLHGHAGRSRWPCAQLIQATA